MQYPVRGKEDYVSYKGLAISGEGVTPSARRSAWQYRMQARDPGLRPPFRQRLLRHVPLPIR